jgi:hypothetical protein
MPYTSHGHPFGTINVDEPRPTARVRCGGVGMCLICAFEASKPTEHIPLPRSLQAEPDSLPARRYREGFRAGRAEMAERIAEQLEAEFVAGTPIVEWAQPGRALQAEAIAAWAASIARGLGRER